MKLLKIEDQECAFGGRYFVTLPRRDLQINTHTLQSRYTEIQHHRAHFMRVARRGKLEKNSAKMFAVATNYFEYRFRGIDHQSNVSGMM